MPVPDYQSIMLPLVRLAADGQERTMGTAIESLASDFGLNQAERQQLLPSGRQATFNNRVAWAGTYLRKAGLLQATGRGRFRISERGRQVLAANPARIDVALLMQFPEFREFRTQTVAPPRPDGGEGRTADGRDVDARPPRELLEATYLELRRVVEQNSWSAPRRARRLGLSSWSWTCS